MGWSREGQTIKTMYLGTFNAQGIVTNSRVKYGAGDVQHTVQLTEPLLVYGRLADILLVDEHDILEAIT